MSSEKKTLVRFLQDHVAASTTILLDGSLPYYQGPFSTLMSRWRKIPQHNMSAKLCFEFSDPYSAFLDPQDRYLAGRIAASELTMEIQRQRMQRGGEVSPVPSLNLGTGPGLALLCCSAMAFYLHIPDFEIPQLLFSGRITRETAPQEAAWRVLIGNVAISKVTDFEQLQRTHRLVDDNIPIPPIILLPAPNKSSVSL